MARLFFFLNLPITIDVCVLPVLSGCTTLSSYNKGYTYMSVMPALSLLYSDYKSINKIQNNVQH